MYIVTILSLGFEREIWDLIVFLNISYLFTFLMVPLKTACHILSKFGF